MDAGLTAAVFGLVGAMIGSVSSIATMVVQSRYRDKRDRTKQILDVSLAEYSAHLELAKADRAPRAVLPITAYVHNNAQLLDALEAGDLTPDRITRIMRKNGDFFRAVQETDQAQRKAT
ncbi:hypothetical protein [Bradyrhizobium sp. Gha]|uniref:hypothetical protein n=1 Tax=Bradyrhizobium sp. Gha TaxID=1855318 RepID=UPI0008DEB806|nr:hypothetical protein [Bradyrhizobium sp. Gha]SFI39633.1 hypothetical protein SAMN05216525_10858 [Bradyrhizobium sp. Gha]